MHPISIPPLRLYVASLEVDKDTQFFLCVDLGEKRYLLCEKSENRANL